MSKFNTKVKSSIKNKIFHFNRICRSCLTERGHLRDIFSTRLPFMIESCAGIKVFEKDNLPSKICVSCFHQIAKFYTFKKKLERNDRILRNYLKQKKCLGSNGFSDILHKAVNDAEIISPNDKSSKDDQESSGSSDEDVPLSERFKTKKCPTRLLRQSKEKANQIIDHIIKEEEDEDLDEDDQSETFTSMGYKIIEGEFKSEETCASNLQTSSLDIIFDGPPPLVPLVLSNAATASSSSTAKTLSENAPPLVPIKPFVSLNPVAIVNVLNDTIETPVELKLQCSICSEEFNNVPALKNHRLYQCQTSNLQCNICKKEFNDRTRLIGHLKGHMVSKDYACKICCKRYPNPSTFRVHMRTHTGERPYKCQVCNKGFVRWAGVVGHMKTHTSTKPYKCETCGKGFKISSNLERHKVLHSGILPYCCSYCGKTFSQSDNLQLHVRTYHTNDRPYLCNECGKRFVSSTRLKRHMWVHTGFKPYNCRFCPKAYSNSNDRKNHERGHTGGGSEADKPYACNICDMRFLHPCRLAKHMKTHERPYPCHECTKAFSSDSLLNKHLTNKHGAQFVDHLSMPLTVEEVYINYQ